jgi:hypothetical protein
LKNSARSRCGPIIVAQEPAEAIPAGHAAAFTIVCGRWSKAHIPQALMIALGMIMDEVLLEDRVEAPFTEYDRLIERFLFDGAHEPLAVGIEIGTLGR